MKKTLTLLLCLALVLSSLCIIPVAAATEVWDGETVSTSLSGSGTEEDPYLIQNGADLAFMRETINAGEANAEDKFYASCYYKQTADINLGGAAVDPIGTSTTTGQCFAGSYDGQHHTISDFTITSTAKYIGLFGYSKGATFNNINVANSTVIGNCSSKDTAVGTLVAYIINDGDAVSVVSGCTTASTCTVKAGTSAGAQRVGGLVGWVYASSTVINCVNNATTIYEGTSTVYVGGITSTLGKPNAVLQNCINNGVVKATSGGASGTVYVGGIVGLAGGSTGDVEIKNCYNTGLVGSEVVTSGNVCVGGIAGINNKAQATIKDCYNIGTISASKGIGSIVGAVAGSNADESTYNYGLKLTDAAGEKGYGSVANTVTGLADHAYLAVATQDTEITLSNGQKSTIAAEIAAIKAIVDLATARPAAPEEPEAPEAVSDIVERKLSLGEDLALTYFATVTAEDKGDNAVVMSFTMKDTRGEVITSTVDPILEEDTYTFRFEHIAPQVIAETITVSLVTVDAEGAVVKTLDTLEDSVKDYLDDIATAENASATLKALVSDLLVYGQTSYDYLNLSSETVAPVLVEDAEPAWFAPSEAAVAESTPDVSESEGNSKFVGAFVHVSNVNQIGFVYTPDAEKVVTVKINGVEVKAEENNGTYTVYTDGIKAKFFGTDYTAELFEDGKLVQTYTMSINDYAFGMQNDAEAGAVVVALYRYGVSAAAYAAN